MSVMDALHRHNALSFEVFPPRTDVGMGELCGEDGILRRLYTLGPDAISCTYSAGGTNAGKNLEVLDRVVKDGICIPVTHFACIGNTEESARRQLQTYLEHGVHHILALRGDQPAGRAGAGGDFQSTPELVAFVRQEFGSQFTIAVAAAPEGHPGCRSLEAEIDSLKRKQDSGADYIITQLCWDMDTFRCWLDSIRAAAIRLPIETSVMPVVDQAETIHAALSRNGSVMPRPLCEIISKNWILPNPFVKDPFDADVEQKKADFQKAGLEYTVNQIHEFRACGADGIRLLTRNQFGDAALIVRESGLLKEWKVEN
ncbi:MAG: methylenetetrahydrofolate reductase [Eubacteriales bacterium]|nr:methylenetetrahydrofolate reductase [Eubacteriales bacterium]